MHLLPRTTQRLMSTWRGIFRVVQNGSGWGECGDPDSRRCPGVNERRAWTRRAVLSARERAEELSSDGGGRWGAIASGWDDLPAIRRRQPPTRIDQSETDARGYCEIAELAPRFINRFNTGDVRGV